MRALGVALLGFVAGSTLAAPDAAEVSRALAPIRLKHDLPALAGAIVDTRGLVVAGATGVRKRGDTTPATPKDRWHLGSNTKAMTATLAARFVERGRLRMESTLGETFPELAGAMRPAARGSMIEQRLRAVAFGGSAPLAFAPGAGTQYSNLGYAMAGAMRTLESWAEFIADNLRGARGEKASLAPETYRRLHTAQPGGDYAYGWAIAQRDWAGGPAIHHNGSNTMNFSVAWLAPRRGFAVLVVSNQGGERAERGLDEAASALIQMRLKP